MTPRIRPCRCGKPLPHPRTVCRACTHALRAALGGVPWLLEELETSHTRQHATGTVAGPSGGENQSLPWDERASAARRALTKALRDAVDACRDQHIGRSRIADPAKDPAAMSRWLMHRVDDLAKHDAGPRAVDDITSAADRAERVVFWKPRARIYLGPCAYGSSLADQLAGTGCPGDVYADDGEPVGKCTTCDRGVTVVIRQTELDVDLHARLLSAAEIADWAMRMGLDAKRDEVRRRVLYWHRHQRIIAHAHDQRGATKVPLFRYGDVRVLLDLEYGTRPA